jgi:death-on-curing protein
LCEAYNLLLQRGEVFFELQDEHADKIDVIVKTVYANYFGFSRFPTLEKQAAAFFCLIIKDHPFVDGNKRMAVLWLQIFCEIYGLVISTKHISLDVLAVSVEKTKDLDNDQLFGLVRVILFGR